jgi:nucleotide-binding universal stress UspA family protein
MIRKILVPLDGTALAESALPVAAFMVKTLAAEVALLHIIEERRTLTAHKQHHLADVAEAQRYLSDVRSRFFGAGSSALAHVHAIAAKDIARGIALHVEELKCDLIVLCTHGRHLFTHPLFGSIGQRILATTMVPVLIVKPRAFAEPTAFKISRILLPLPADETHPEGIEVAESLAKTLNAQLHVLQIVERYRDISGNETAISRFLPSATSHILDLNADKAAAYLEQIRSKLKANVLTVTTALRRTQPADGIIDEARQSNSDLIVMSTHRRKGFEAFWRGSVASRVCLQCSVPLLLIPEKMR